MEYFLLFLHLIFSSVSFTSGQFDGFTTFNCRSNDTITFEMFCNGGIECDDGSDEKMHSTVQMNFDPLSDWQSCNNPRNDHNASCLVERKKICDGHVACSNLTPCDLKCDTYYLCQNSSKCVPRSTVCNTNPCDGCPEDHEWRNGIGFKCQRGGRECVLPQQLLKDDVADCDGGTDLCFIMNNSTNKDNTSHELNWGKCFQCLNDVTIIPTSRVCDGIIDCEDLSDECLCEGEVPDICDRVITYEEGGMMESTESSGSEIEFPVFEVMDFNDSNFGDMFHHSFFEVDIPTMRPSTGCDVGHVRCEHGKCISREHVCDGIKDCTSDEIFDICQGTVACADATKYEEVCRCKRDFRCFSATSEDFPKLFYGTACNGVAECPGLQILGGSSIRSSNTYPEDECEAFCFTENTNFTCRRFMMTAVGPGTAIRECSPLKVEFGENRMNSVINAYKYCDGWTDCPNGDDEEHCPERFPCKLHQEGHVSIILALICDGTEDCADGSDEAKELCGDSRFYCPSLGDTKVNIDPELVCDFSITCDDATDEMNCTDERFYCENGEPLFVRQRQTFDGRGDCSDWSDECPMLNRSSVTDAFSSRYELIANPILRALVWIMGLLATIGNGGVIIHEIQKLKNIGKLPPVLIANRLLVLNLAVSDILMGVYLLSLGIKSVQVQGHYCSQDLDWRTSTTCVGLGVLTVISSETSVITMVLLTACRLYAVSQPYKSSSRPRKRIVGLMILFAWITSLILAFLPLTSQLSHIFVTMARFEHNPFSRKTTMSLDGTKTLFRRLLTYDLKPNVTVPENIDHFLRTSSWKNLELKAKDLFVHKSFEVQNYMSYYSINSVCIPKFFITTSDPAWVFSFIINLFNFLAFTFVASAYAGIYVKTRRSGAVLKKKEGKQMSSMQRKILRLIITDFCCWIPICIMAFCKLAGADLGPIAYAVAAIVLLPINSALNPVLYSDFPDACYRKFIKRYKVVRSGSNTRDTSLSNYSNSRNRGTMESLDGIGKTVENDKTSQNETQL